MSDENSNLRPYIDPALEVRIVALVLGETSDFEREELERLIAEDADLANFKKRIESTHGLLEEVAGEGDGDASTADLQLPEAMRAKLLATFAGEASSVADEFEGVVDDVAEDPPSFPWRTALAIAAAVALMALIGSMMMPAYHMGLSDASDAASDRPPMIASADDGLGRDSYYFDDATTEVTTASASTSPANIALAAVDPQVRAREALAAMNDYGFIPQAGRDLGVASIAKPDEGNANSIFKRGELDGRTMGGAQANRGRLAPSTVEAAPVAGLAGRGDAGAVGGGGGEPSVNFGDPSDKLQIAAKTPAKSAEDLSYPNFRTTEQREVEEGMRVGHGQVAAIDLPTLDGDERGKKSIADHAARSTVSANGSTGSGGTAIVSGVAATEAADGGKIHIGGTFQDVDSFATAGDEAKMKRPSAGVDDGRDLGRSDPFVESAPQRAPASPKAAAESVQMLGRVAIDENTKTEDRLTRRKDLSELDGKLEAGKPLAMPGLAAQPEVVEFDGFINYGTPIQHGGTADAEMAIAERVVGQAVEDIARFNKSPAPQPESAGKPLQRRLAQLEGKAGQLKELEDSLDSMPVDPFSPAPLESELLHEDAFARSDQMLDTDAETYLRKQIKITSKFVETEPSADGELGFDWLLNQPGTDTAVEQGVTKGLATVQDNQRAASDLTRARFTKEVDANWEMPVNSPVTAGMRSGGYAVTDDSIDGLLAAVVPEPGMGPATAPNDRWFAQSDYLWKDSREEFGALPATPTTTSSFESRTLDAKARGVTARSGEREKVEVVREFLYPTEYEEAEIDAAYKGRAKTAAKAKNKTKVPANLGEIATADEAFSTFSLHVSDVSFKLAQASLESGEWPDAQRIRIEEFVNAFDYGDPLPSLDEKVACQMEQTIHPFLQQRNLLRISMRTAAAGRSGSTPLNLTLVLDNSGSMERHDRRETVARAFDLLAQQLQPNDQATLIGFARTPRLLADQVTGGHRQQLLQLLADTPSEGGTNLEQALQLAAEKASEQKIDGAQNRVILLTDGAANLGDANPESLATTVHAMRTAGIAFDAAGIGADGLNDEILEALTRKGDGRYYLLDRPDDADEGFARQIAGALRPAAMNVKVQIEFNADRVSSYKLLGFEKHRLNKEDFRDDSVDAAEIAAEEAGVAVYQFEPLADGSGDVGTAFLRFRDMSSGEMVEKRWAIPYAPDAPRPEQAAPAVRIATVAALFAAKLKGDVLGESVTLSELTQLLNTLPKPFTDLERIQQLQRMIEQARNLEAR